MSREMDFPPIFPPCPGSSDRESLGVPQSTGTGDSWTGLPAAAPVRGGVEHALMWQRVDQATRRPRQPGWPLWKRRFPGSRFD